MADEEAKEAGALGSALTWPDPRSGHAMAYDPNTKLIFVYGGYNSSKIYST